MQNITQPNDPIQRPYSPSSQEVTSGSVAAQEAASSEGAKMAGNELDLDQISIDTLFEQRPDLKVAYDKCFKLMDDSKDSTEFSMGSLIRSLIELAQVLQDVALVEAENMSKITEKMSLYSHKMNQIPVLKDADNTGKGTHQNATLNQDYGNMLETLRANKGVEEDKAKKSQPTMQSLKDASQSAHEFIGTFLDLLQGISQKITR